jgi:DNA-binding MarR family transcriptional regulator
MNPAEEVLTALRRLIRATDLQSRQLERTVGLTAPQLLLLQLLRQRGQMTIGALAKDMNLSQATVTTVMDRLEDRGLVERLRGETDKRKVYAVLTAEGEKLVASAPPLLQQSFIRQFQDLQPWEQSMILSCLQRVAQMMDAQHLDASPVLDIGALDR